ncbi:lipopolysaccharide biosynthesis protein [Enterococcus hirae]|nr:hypothetical protein [Enterococcus hirae]MBA5270680.1 hypothetical protein [Enterococcus hirae]NVM00631.1 hypothetical protein [Enterococcus hirae]
MNKKVISDIFLNIISLSISTCILQLIVYPVISSNVSISSFGKILTIMGGINVISVVIGGSLNNAQLINQKFYENMDDYYGDFKLLLYRYLFLILAISSIIVNIPLLNISNIEKFSLLILVFLTTLRSYIPVLWRIKLNYKLIMFHSVVTAFGYLVGSILFIFTKNEWTIIFILGEVFSLFFLMFKSNFSKIKLTKSVYLKKINIDFLNLLSSNIVANILVYFDRFLLQGFLGSNEVSIYFAASIFGKLASMVLQPISGVFLSYLSRENSERKKLYYLYFLLASVTFGIILFLSSLLISPIFVQVLYKDLYNEAKEYMTLANLSTIILITGSLLQPVLLKFANLLWQNVIQIIYGLVFVLLGYILISSHGMFGFVIASLFSNIIRFLLFVLVGYFSIWRNKNND